MAGIFQLGVFSEGFDETTTSSQIYSSGGSGTISSTHARLAAQAGASSQGIQFNNSNPQLALGVNLATLIANFAFLVTDLPISGLYYLFTWHDAGANQAQCSLVINTAGQLQFRRAGGYGFGDGTLIGSSSTATITPNTWNHIQAKVTVNNTTGVAECRLNGNATPVLSLTGANTRGSANNYSDAIRMGSNTSNMTIKYDDWTMQDTTGTAPLDTYLGDKKIITLLPSADSVTAGQNDFATTPSQSAGSHYLNVDEVPPDSDTSYNSSAIVTDLEMYRYPSLVAPIGTISFANAKIRAEKDDAGTRQLRINAYRNAVTANGTTLTMASSYAYFNQVFSVDPSSGIAFVASDFNAAPQIEFGVEVMA